MSAVHGMLVTLPQMVDLALGSPEVGAVNFNILNAVLHVIIQQMKLGEHLVEYRGPDKDRIDNLIKTTLPPVSIKITEINEKDKWLLHEQKGMSAEEIKTQKINDSKIGSKVIVVEPTKTDSVQIPQIVVGLSQNYLTQIQDDIKKLKTKMDEIMNLPTNATLIDIYRKSGLDSTKPVFDIWQTFNITKRVTAVEQSLEKMTSIVEDLIQDIITFETRPKQISFPYKSSQCSAIEASRLKAGGEEGDKGESEDAAKQTQKNDSSNKRSSSFFGNVFSEITGRLDAMESRVSTIESKIEAESEIDLTGIAKELVLLKKQQKNIVEELGHVTSGAQGKGIADLLGDIEVFRQKAEKDDENQVILEEKLLSYDEKLNNLDESLTSEINRLHGLFMELENELTCTLNKINAKEDAVDTQSLSDIYSKMLKLQDDMDNMGKVSENLREILMEKQLTIDLLTEQIEVLKTGKADREDLEDALADKADTQQMNRKVSLNQFDATCDDITKNIENAMSKLTQQEEIWKSTLDEIHTAMGTKLDKGEFDPLKEFVNKKIKNLQERVKTLIALRQEQEAAGTKHRLLKDVNCISCDKRVVMSKENKFLTFSGAPPLYGGKSIKPYITYELDAVRKQQRSLPKGGKVINQIESAIYEKTAMKDKISTLDKIIPPGHLCNRYCGGSHTMTLPQQRVAHVGHFLSQWGPHAISLDEDTTIKGTDGQMYKARENTQPQQEKTIESENIKTACIQTDDIGDHIPRMSSALLKISTKSKPSSKKRTSILINSSDKGLATITEETEDKEKKSGSKSSLTGSKKSEQRSTSKLDVKNEGGRRSSDGQRSSRRGSTSLKRLSQIVDRETGDGHGDEGKEETTEVESIAVASEA